jgi:citrate lyase beta subunit
MLLNVYHFLKYDTDTPFDYYIKNYSPLLTLCFDLEDSIQDLRNPANTMSLKKDYREILEHLFIDNINKMKDLNIGIRLNQASSVEFEKDIAALVKLKGKLPNLTCFLPKTENSSDISYLHEVLDRNCIPFADLIAVIESKKGMNNLSYILKQRSDKFNKIAFGHCDYNTSIDNFPFYHQDSIEYWNVVDSMLTLVESMGFVFINSPCPFLDDEELFISILNRLTANTKSQSIGQIVLTHKQASLCQKFSDSYNPGTQNLSGTHSKPVINDAKELKEINTEYAKKLISDYEFNMNGKAFSVVGTKRVLISPHEYLAAKRYLKNV